MKLEALVAALTLLLVGCTPTSQQPAPAPKPRTTAEKPVEATPEPEPANPSENPSRLYQLRDLDRISLNHRGHELTLLLMDNDAKRMEGMMFLQDDEVTDTLGMLFVFPDAQERGFWMKNTLIPLDIAFLSDNRKVLNVERMKPLDESKVSSVGAARYVLEMKAGAFERYRIRAGQTLEIPKGLSASE